MNPIAQVYAAIWTLLEANTDFTDLVRTGNRIKFIGGNREAGKEILATADTPQVAVVPLGLRPHLDSTSSSSNLLSLWTIEVLPGTVQIEVLSNLDWAIYRALSEWRSLRTTLIWDGEYFVKQFRPVDVDPEIKARRELRVPKGWISVWAGECNMWFSRGIVQL